MRYADISNQKFDRLLVIKSVGSKNRFKLWLCQCDCGQSHIAKGSYLKRGMIKSCGCLRKENQRKATLLPNNEGQLNIAFKNYRSSAGKRRLDFSLSKIQFDHLMKQCCRYCGNQPRSMYGGYLGTGIDRKDSSLGYTLSNCIPCCTKCNKMKSALSAPEFIDHATRISKHFRTEALIKMHYSEIYDA